MPAKYAVGMEIAGPAAMFTRPDTGGSFVSYPAPTYSAAKGIFESIARLRSAFIRPVRVEICRPIQYHGTLPTIVARCGRAINYKKTQAINSSR